MSHKFLLMWLEAPLQSWGFDSKFDRRDTQSFPTKSGVLGLICCALGAGGEQREFLAEMAPMKQTVLSFVRTKQRTDQAQIKVDRETFLRDFQMVGSGYDDQNNWENLMIPKKCDGNKPTNSPGTKMTYRYYLQDAFFAAIVQVPEDLAISIEQALQNPVWDLFLGRKNCVPTDFICRGLFDNEALAVDAALSIANGKTLALDFQVKDGVHEGELLYLNDVPIQFGVHKQYRERRVTVSSYGSHE